MSNNTKATTIRVLSLTKARLDAARGTKSSSSFIDSMLNYFEVTGVEPSSIKFHPGIEIVNRVDSIMKVIKSIEKSKINPLLEKFDLILESNPNLNKVNSTRESQVTDEEINQLVNKVNNLTEQLKEKERKIQRLETDLYNTKNNNYETSSLRKISEIKSLVNLLFTDKYSKYDILNKNYLIPDNIKEMLLTQLEEI